MPLNGSGTYAAPASTWNPAVTSTTINSTDWAALLADLTTALSTMIAKDGQSTPTANIPMGGFKLTGAGAATANGQYLRYDESAGLLTAAGDVFVASSAATLARVTASLAAMNVGLAASVSANALTITLQGSNGSNQSATNPGVYPFRNVTVATGTPTWLAGTAAATLVISSGSTLGARSTVPFRVWIVMFNDGGTLRLGAINCLTTVAGAGAGSDVTAIYSLGAWGIASSTAEGGAGAADSAQTFYTGTAVSSKSFVVLGYMSWESGLTTAGTWDAAPTRIQLFGAGIALPGQIVQVQRTDTGAVATGTTTVPYDDTIPQSGEGDQYMSQAITPSSAANVLTVNAQLMLSTTVAIGNVQTSALFQDAVANALKAAAFASLGNAVPFSMSLGHRMLAATTSAVTLKVRSGNQTANTTTFNGNASVREFGGVINSFIEVTEVMT